MSAAWSARTTTRRPTAATRSAAAPARGTVTATGNWAGGLVGWNNGPISDSSALDGSVSGAAYVGGLVGQNNDAQADGSNAISGSTARGTVTATGNWAGGLVGWNNGPISDSAALNPSVTGASSVGGLVGTNGNDSDTTIVGLAIDRSIATADVTGTGQNVAGLAGFNNGPIRDSYASGAVQGASSSIGGLVGNNHRRGEVINSRADGAVSDSGAAFSSAVGGLAGYSQGSVTGSVATGAVTATGTANSQVGGLVGQSQGSISRSAATGAVTGGRLVGGLVGVSSSASGTPSSVSESWASGDVRAITSASVSSSGRIVGGLIGQSRGTAGASFATGNVSGYGAAGGLIGQNEGAVVATYATGNVTVSDMPPCTSSLCTKDAGGLIGRAGHPDALVSNVQASYSTGMVSKVSGSSAYRLGGLAGSGLRVALAPHADATFTDNYWDTQTSGPTFGVGTDDEDASGMIDGTESLTPGVTGQTTTALKTPTGYSGIFGHWNVPVPGTTARTGGPWDFGGATDYPVLRGLGAPPSFPPGTATLSVAEERAADTPIGSPLTATGAGSNRLSYKLVGADGSHFGINGTTGQLLTKTDLDYEKPVDGGSRQHVRVHGPGEQRHDRYLPHRGRHRE